MDGVCIRHTELPSSSALLCDYLYRFDRLSRFYSHPPGIDAVVDAARAVEVTAEHRKRLVTALSGPNHGAGAATGRHLELLGRPGTTVVVTGQQVGLYGGPVFAIYKALSAIRVAETLRKRGVNAVPVFWLATEDHDLEEVNHAWLFGSSHDPLTLEAETDASPGKPVGSVEIQHPLAARISEIFSGLPYAEEASAIAAETYCQGCNFGEGFSRLFQKLFEPYGLLLLDPMRREIRELAAPLVDRAIHEASTISSELIARGDELVQGGYHAQVHVTGETSLVFLLEEGRRIPLRRNGAEYSCKQGVFTSDQLRSRLETHPDALSPNALLRPVVQDFLLPTAAYIAGPAELAYLAQAEVLYRRLLGRMPVVLPRASMTLLSHKADSLLKRYGLQVPDCFVPKEVLRQKVADGLIPPSLEVAFTRGEQDISQALTRLSGELSGFDPTLGAALEKARGKMLYQFAQMRGKAGREGLRRHAQADGHTRYLANTVFPHKKLQERTFSILPFLAEHGEGLIAKIYQAINPECHDHQVLVV